MGTLLTFSFKSAPRHITTLKLPTPTPSISPVAITNRILFVPYWTMQSGIDSGYNEYIYFGITPDKNGISHNESGFSGIPTFLHAVPSDAKKLLGVRMTNNTINEFVLQNNDVQQKLITDTIRIAQENGFDGILLDLEYSAFPFDSVIQHVTIFSQRFADSTKSHNLLFYQALFGDTFYRGRPYNVKGLVKNTDRLLIMAYDFHKANGDPGANFPLELGDDEYSFREMVNNFTKEIPASKVSVILGMFGYDWKINNKGKSIGQAESLSVNEITQKFLTTCHFTNCTKSIDPKSLETHIQYTDSAGDRHVVWFEDKNSAGKKEEVLQKSGVSSVGFWANGYF